MSATETKTETVARILAATYWRGRVEGLYSDQTLAEYLIVANSDRDQKDWEPLADFVLSL